MMKLLFFLSLAFAGSLGTFAHGQAPAVAAPTQSYEAVAIKPNKSGSGGTSIHTRDDTYQATNISIKQLLVNAYGIRDGLISGLPGWAESDRFDINAKIVDYDPVAIKNMTREQRRAMLAAMVESRFHVKVHVEVKQLPVYDLVVMKDGPKFKENPPLPPAADPEEAKKQERNRGNMNTNGNNGNVELTATAVKMADIVYNLSNQIDRTVIDKTGLTSEYDFHLKWTSENAPQPLPDDAPPLLFTALQEQLGLKLVASKGPVNTLVVDHVEQPTEN